MHQSKPLKHHARVLRTCSTSVHLIIWNYSSCPFLSCMKSVHFTAAISTYCIFAKVAGLLKSGRMPDPATEYFPFRCKIIPCHLLFPSKKKEMHATQSTHFSAIVSFQLDGSTLIAWGKVHCRVNVDLPPPPATIWTMQSLDTWILAEHMTFRGHVHSTLTKFMCVSQALPNAESSLC